MIRYLSQLIIAMGLLAVLMIPQIGVIADDTTENSTDREYHPAFPVPSAALSSAQKAAIENRFSPLLEHEITGPTNRRVDQFCDLDFRLCAWWSENRQSNEDQQATDNTNPVVPDGSGSDSGENRNAGQNRSVVGWSSASISSANTSKHPDPIMLDVPSLGISAEIKGVGTDSNRAMEVPDDFNTVGWYRYGPSPGEPGNSVIAGHLDDHRGRSVFFDLQYVEVGSKISVTYEDGSDQEFRVSEKRAYDAGNLPSTRLFNRDGNPALALITCGGSWDSSAGRYSETVVVYAEPV
jgi:sortase (surface protein transpeptidase)